MKIFTTIYKKWPGCYSYLMLITLWIGIAAVYPLVLVPGPFESLCALFNLAVAGQLWAPLALTFLRFAAGFAVAFLLGAGLGVWAGSQQYVYKLIQPAVSLLQAVPPVSWMLLAILWLGTNGGTQVFVVSIALFPVFFFNSVQGIRRVPRDLLEMATVFHIGRARQVRDIIWPALLPFWSAAFAINIGTGWKTVVMSELISSQTGIGAAMNTARVYLKTEEVMGWTLLVALLGMGLEGLVRASASGRRGKPHALRTNQHDV
ncbi:NitT/TauT family transport system permease protein [Aneurinibacillus soli]|uniref:Putative aliphatic sulfonates transport permease protein SsuC n=2 Tax=Aneurinibacillus soli TaxID=1500254 RepID=A0A0U5BLE6_9BACL|nr:NitT/TauT family transport system permease protein [Aneurinibacillus soli]BAU29006.1 putative aliphatic sulfonates transport permease protein SsuC [Aneurinibacillus soli]